MHPMFGAFVGNTTWFAILISVHVLGAVIGLGPTFGFAIMGPMAGKVGPEGSLALLEAMEKIERGMVLPILLTTQLLSGIGLIFNLGFNHGFFSGRHAWLVAGIGVYIVAMTLSLTVQTPAVAKIIRMAKSGQAGTPEFGATVATTQKFGPILTVLAFTIVLLMAWKPGS